MESMQLPGARAGLVAQDVPTSRALAAISLLAAAFGIHIFFWVDNAWVNDNSILWVVPWLLYPGIVAAIAVRSRIELLAIGVAAILPAAAFGLFGFERLQAMGIGCGTWLRDIDLDQRDGGVTGRRPSGTEGSHRGRFVGAATFLLAFGVVVFLLLFLAALT